VLEIEALWTIPGHGKEKVTEMTKPSIQKLHNLYS
jgi:hypothetical protein